MSKIDKILKVQQKQQYEEGKGQIIREVGQNWKKRPQFLTLYLLYLSELDWLSGAAQLSQDDRLKHT